MENLQLQINMRIIASISLTQTLEYQGFGCRYSTLAH